MKNPKWHRDEIILALNLYFDPERGPVDAKNPKVIALSDILNSLPIFSFRPDAERFRNPNGVTLKLSNFMAIDPNHSGKGMKGHSRLDKQLFDEYSSNREELKTTAAQILKVLDNKIILNSLKTIEDDENSEVDSVREGQILYKLHKYRERNRKIIDAKKKNVLKLKGKLSCEVCDFDFESKYGELGKNYIECHHTKPLSGNDSITVTKIEDLALVCSNCHRMLHRRIATLTVRELKLLI